MREIVDMRIPEARAAKYLDNSVGRQLGTNVRQIVVDRRTPLFERIGQIESKLRNQGQHFFLGWSIERQYTRAEMEEAQLFHFIVESVFEPEGEEQGTLYDEKIACPICGAGAMQTTDLALVAKSIPAKKDISITFAKEIVVSHRLKELLETNGIGSLRFAPIRNGSIRGQELENWFQMFITLCGVKIDERTKTGISPFDYDPKNEYRCRCGDNIGFTLLSEVFVERSSYRNEDIATTAQFVGPRMGSYRPQRIMVISPNLKMLLEQNKITGYRVEVAYLV